MNILLVDSNPVDVDYFMALSQKIPTFQHIDVAHTQAEVLRFMHKSQYGLIVWEMQLPDHTGLDILKTFPNCPPVIALTRSRTYSLEAFEFGVVDYLIKPYTFERLMIDINRLLIGRPGPESSPARVFVFFKIGNGNRRVPISQIAYGQARAMFTMVYLTTGEKVLVSMPISDTLAQLPAGQFLRVHKSYFVNLDQIIHVQGLKIELSTDKTLLPIGKTYRQQFELHMAAYLKK